MVSNNNDKGNISTTAITVASTTSKYQSVYNKCINNSIDVSTTALILIDRNQTIPKTNMMQPMSTSANRIQNNNNNENETK